MKLNARQVDTAKRKEKPYKLSDGGGLFLLVNTNSSRYWRLKYRIAGKEKLLSKQAKKVSIDNTSEALARVTKYAILYTYVLRSH